MTCDPLAYTGPGIQLGWWLIVAVAFLVIGTLVLLLTRGRGRAVTAALLLLITGAAMSITAGTPTRALAGDCFNANNSLTIVQTSVMVGLAPGVVPADITGTVRNNGTDSTYLAAVDVKIIRVLKAPGSARGACDPSDYTLQNSLMPVGLTLPAGGSAAFQGASIGFNNKSTNQDACQGATVQLRYTANPN